MIDHIEASKDVNRPEFVVGWYHSHPGYGCWLSGIDVNSEILYQKVQDPCVAIVIDPHRTMSAGKVEIGCFRTYSEAHIAQVEKNMGQNKGQDGGAMSVRMDKVEEMGLHHHKYYQLETSFYKTQLDNDLLDQLWSQYWQSTLSMSPLLNN